MERKVGTISRGIRCPIIREGDNLAEIVVDRFWMQRKAKALKSGTGMSFP